jgi:hypothetical protein
MAFTEELEFGVEITERGKRKFTIRSNYRGEAGEILIGGGVMDTRNYITCSGYEAHQSVEQLKNKHL